MVTHRRAIFPLLLLSIALVAACDKVPLLAPTGTVINLFPTTNSVSLNSEITIVATVIENGVASGGSGGPSGGGGSTRAGNGTPVQNGTVVSFTTTIGRIEPSEARTSNGQVNVRLITAGTSGTATITAYSGGASSQLTLKVGTAAVETVSVTTTPQTLGSSGGSVLVIATALDGGGSPVGGVPMTFSTTAGSVSPSTVTTDASGVATATLTTTAQAEVTATTGSGKSGKATVTVRAFALKDFVADPTSASAGVPVKFTATANDGVTITNVRLDFGDGDRTDLGTIAAGQSRSTFHPYGGPGIYTATATATDSSGGTSQLQTGVVVGSLQVTLTADDRTPAVGAQVVFTVNFTGGSAPPLDHFEWVFDDGTPLTRTTGSSLTHTFTSRGQKTVRVDVFGVGGGKIGTATTQVDVQ